MEYSSWRICPICGEGFSITAEWGLTDYNGKPVCTPYCNNIAYNRMCEKKKKREKSTYEKHCEYQRRYRERKQNGERKPRFMKPVLVIKKADGSIMARHPSVRATAEATGISITTVSEVCRGYKQTRGDYTFVFAENQQQTDGKAIWERVPALKLVLQFNLKGEFVARHESQKAAALATGCTRSSISLCCRHKQYQTRGFTFMFESEYEENEKGKENELPRIY